MKEIEKLDYKKFVDEAIGETQLIQKKSQKVGLLKKYIVSKTDGTPIDFNSDYFVLRLDTYQNDPKHRLACLKALKTYADEIDNLELKKDLYNKYNLINL
jgi:hypothetical protein